MKNKEFDVTKPLPTELLITSAGSHLYRIGLSHFRNGSQIRNKIHNPLLIAIINIIFLFRAYLSLLLRDENPKVFIWIVDSAYFINAKIHFNVALIVGLILSLISQYLYYNDYKNNKPPNYLKPFEMMSGLVSPQSIGLTDRVQIIQFIKISK